LTALGVPFAKAEASGVASSSQSHKAEASGVASSSQSHTPQG